MSHVSLWFSYKNAHSQLLQAFANLKAVLSGMIRFNFWNASSKKRILCLKGANLKILWVLEWHMFKMSYDWWMFLYYKRIAVHLLWLKIVISFSLVSWWLCHWVGAGWGANRWDERLTGPLVTHVSWEVTWHPGKVIKFAFVSLFLFEVTMDTWIPYWDMNSLGFSSFSFTERYIFQASTGEKSSGY